MDNLILFAVLQHAMQVAIEFKEPVAFQLTTDGVGIFVPTQQLAEQKPSSWWPASPWE